MFEVAYCVSGAHVHDLDHCGEHMRRIFDLTLSSQSANKVQLTACDG